MHKKFFPFYMIYYENWTRPLKHAVYLNDELQLGIENLFKLDKIADFLNEHPIQHCLAAARNS